MQTNDLNRLVSQVENIHNLKRVLVSNISNGRTYGKTALLKQKVPIGENLLQKVRKDVERFQTLGKSRRWIRRWIKRKYDIIEY